MQTSSENGNDETLLNMRCRFSERRSDVSHCSLPPSRRNCRRACAQRGHGRQGERTRRSRPLGLAPASPLWRASATMPTGAEAIRAYQTEGIDVAYIRRDANLPTGTAAIVVDDAAENCIIAVPGANACWRPMTCGEQLRLFRKPRLFSHNWKRRWKQHWKRSRWRTAGVLTMLTPAPAMELPNELFRLCDVCVPNKTELERLAGTSCQNRIEVQAAANRLRSRGVRIVVVTMDAAAPCYSTKLASQTSRLSRYKPSIPPAPAMPSPLLWPSTWQADWNFATPHVE